MDMKQTKAEGLLREFEFVFSPEEVNKKWEERLIKLGHSLKVSGFRPGKIPLALVKQRYGQQAKEETIEQLIKEGTHRLIETHKLRVALQPQIKEKDYAEGGLLKCTVSLELLPDIEKVDLSQFKFERLVCEVTPQQVEEAFERLRKNHTQLKELDKKVKAQKGHVVHLAFKGMVDGKPIPRGASEGMDLELGSQTFIPGFEDQLIGLKAGDKKEFEITFPQEYNDPKLAGQQAVFSVTLKEIKEKVLPELTEDFAKEIGASSLDELKKSISEHLLQEHDSMCFLDAKRKILDKFSETFKIDLPKGLVDLEFHSIWTQLQKEEEKKPGSEKDDEKLKKEYREMAERRVLLGLLLAEIGREHKVTVTQREFEKAVAREAVKYPGMERKVYEYYNSNGQAQAALRAPLFEDKVIELILEKAAVTKKKVSFEDLNKRVDDLMEGDDL